MNRRERDREARITKEFRAKVAEAIKTLEGIADLASYDEDARGALSDASNLLDDAMGLHDKLVDEGPDEPDPDREYDDDGEAWAGGFADNH